MKAGPCSTVEESHFCQRRMGKSSCPRGCQSSTSFLSRVFCDVHCFLSPDPGQVEEDKGTEPGQKQTVVCCSLALDCLPPCYSPSLLSLPPFLVPSLFLLVLFLKSCSYVDMF